MVFNPLSPDQAMLWDAVALVISFTAVMAVVQINGILQKKNMLPTVVTRKLVHTLVAPVFILTWPLYTGMWFSRYFAAVVPLMFVALFYAIGSGMMKNEAFVNSMSRSGEAKELLQGTLYYSLLVLITCLLWFYVPAEGIAAATPNAIIVMGCLAGGDGLADMIGRRYGTRKYGFGGSVKSIEGSVGMFIGSVIFPLKLIWVLSWGIPAWNVGAFVLPVLVFAIGATIIEGITPKNLDNWTIAIGVAAMMLIANAVAPGFWPYPII
jgi:dolichol kinase